MTSATQTHGAHPAHNPARRARNVGERTAARVTRGSFARFSSLASIWLGSKWAFSAAILIVLIWAATGPIFHYSNTWQLVINTGTTIVTFLMVFLIQNTQNRDGAAVQAKLDELIRAVEGARNHFIGIEHLTEEQLEAIRAVCEREALADVGAAIGRMAVIDEKPGPEALK